jgi:hypothetical protein
MYFEFLKLSIETSKIFFKFFKVYELIYRNIY